MQNVLSRQGDLCQLWQRLFQRVCNGIPCKAGHIFLLALGLGTGHFAHVNAQGGRGHDALQAHIQSGGIASQERLIADLGLHGVNLIGNSLLSRLPLDGDVLSTEAVRTHNCTGARVSGQQILRDVPLHPPGSDCVHPLAYNLIVGIKSICLLIKYGLPTPAPPAGGPELQRHSQDKVSRECHRL